MLCKTCGTSGHAHCEFSPFMKEYNELPPCPTCKDRTKYVGVPICNACGGTGKFRQDYLTWKKKWDK